MHDDVNSNVEVKKMTRPDKAARLSRKSKITNHVVKMKLNSFCDNPSIRTLLRRNVENINKMQSMAYHLINFHVLRCFRDNVPLPDFTDLSFYRNSLLYTTKEYEQKTNPNYPGLYHTYDLYMRQYNTNPPSSQNAADLISTAALQMKTCVRNHIILNFEARLVRYYSLRYSTSKKKARCFLYNLFHTQFVPTSNEMACRHAAVPEPSERSNGSLTWFRQLLT